METVSLAGEAVRQRLIQRALDLSAACGVHVCVPLSGSLVKSPHRSCRRRTVTVAYAARALPGCGRSARPRRRN